MLVISNRGYDYRLMSEVQSLFRLRKTPSVIPKVLIPIMPITITTIHRCDQYTVTCDDGGYHTLYAHGPKRDHCVIPNAPLNYGDSWVVVKAGDQNATYTVLESGIIVCS